jgi:hypothetical protein
MPVRRGIPAEETRLDRKISEISTLKQSGSRRCRADVSRLRKFDHRRQVCRTKDVEQVPEINSLAA